MIYNIFPSKRGFGISCFPYIFKHDWWIMRTYPMQDSMTVTKTQRETPKDPKRPQKCEGVSRQCRTEQDRRQGFFSRSPSNDLCKRFEKDLMRKYLQNVSLQYPSRRPRYKVPWLPCLLTRSLKFFTRSLEKTCFQGLSSFFFNKSIQHVWLLQKISVQDQIARPRQRIHRVFSRSPETNFLHKESWQDLEKADLCTRSEASTT